MFTSMIVCVGDESPTTSPTAQNFSFLFFSFFSSSFSLCTQKHHYIDQKFTRKWFSQMMAKHTKAFDTAAIRDANGCDLAFQRCWSSKEKLIMIKWPFAFWTFSVASFSLSLFVCVSLPLSLSFFEDIFEETQVVNKVLKNHWKLWWDALDKHPWTEYCGMDPPVIAIILQPQFC